MEPYVRYSLYRDAVNGITLHPHNRDMKKSLSNVQTKKFNYLSIIFFFKSNYYTTLQLQLQLHYNLRVLSHESWIKLPPNNEVTLILFALKLIKH